MATHVYVHVYTCILNGHLSFFLQSILSHGAVADCAVVGKEDPLKGHVPLALCVLRNGEIVVFSDALGSK